MEFLVTAVILIVISLLAICAFYKVTKMRCAPLLKDISQMGYDANEVQIFCYRIDASLEDFIASKGLQKQYELFREGKTSDFIKTAESNKKASDAHSTGLATGLTVGIAVRAKS